MKDFISWNFAPKIFDDPATGLSPSVSVLQHLQKLNLKYQNGIETLAA